MIIRTKTLTLPPNDHQVTLVTLWEPCWGKHFLVALLDADPRDRTTPPPPPLLEAGGQWYGSLHWFRMGQTAGPAEEA
jgi:hypothetical protein